MDIKHVFEDSRIVMLEKDIARINEYCRYSDDVNLLIHTDSKQSLRPLSFLSRTGNVLHTFINQLFSFLPFNKAEEVQYIIVIPSEILCKTSKNDFPTYGKSFFVSLVFSCKAGGFAPFRAAVYKRSLPLLIRILP